MSSGLLRKAAACGLALAGTTAVTAAARAIHLNPNTAGFAFLVVVLFSSLRGGLLAGAVASVAATLCYNFFFIPPVHTFRIAEPDNWITLAAFLVTSVVVSRLVIAARIEAGRAEQRRREVETLARERERFIEETAHVEALRESERLKTSLLRAISHDLTTPLTAITIHTATLTRKCTDDELRQVVAGIARETEHLHRRIDNLLSMARLEAGRARPRPEPTPPGDLFHALRDSMPLLLQSRNVTVHVDDGCSDLYVDPSLALEVLVNLVENAHRVSPSDAPIELLAGPEPLDPGRVTVEVRDRGPGLPTGVVDAEGHLLSSATSDVAQRGLGLEIARSLAAANGGSLRLAPREGGGTIARFEVPAALLPVSEGA